MGNAWGKFCTAVVVILIIVMCVQCNSTQNQVYNYGEDMEISLDPNRKLVNITWDDNNLWYLTREMDEDEQAEDYLFQQKSNMGIWQGTVTIHEVKMDESQYQEWLASSRLAVDYYRDGNFAYDEDRCMSVEVYIGQNDDGTYTLIKDYRLDESGRLVPADE